MQGLRYPGIFLILSILFACGETDMPAEKHPATEQHKESAKGEDWQTVEPQPPRTVRDQSGFVWQTEQFMDIRILRYQIPGWGKLSVQQKQLVYSLTQAGLAGRDILWDQHYRHNLAVRRFLESIYAAYPGDKGTLGWQRFETYLKRVWFANGIHHHYSTIKLDPGFPATYFAELVRGSDPQGFPLTDNETLDSLLEKLSSILFDPAVRVRHKVYRHRLSPSSIRRRGSST